MNCDDAEGQSNNKDIHTVSKFLIPIRKGNHRGWGGGGLDRSEAEHFQ